MLGQTLEKDAAAAAGAGGPGRYLPPHLRPHLGNSVAGGKGDGGRCGRCGRWGWCCRCGLCGLCGRYGHCGKGGKEDWQAQQQDASLRVTNLSEECKEGDVQDLFGRIGRLQRVYLAKDQTTGESRGFAFITYGNKADLQRAVDQLNGHSYANLILQVQCAKPRV